jgi:hypothetical protein
VAIHDRLAQALDRASRKPEVRKAYKRLQEANDVTIHFQDRQDEDLVILHSLGVRSAA